MNALFDTFALPLLGGVLIGLASAALMFFNGRIAGISGILGTALTFPRGDASWRWSFAAGLLLGGAALFWQAGPEVFHDALERPLLVVALGGLLVGFGTRLGSGCTSGHGICGIGRLSPRSTTSVLTFIVTGALTVVALRLLEVA